MAIRAAEFGTAVIGIGEQNFDELRNANAVEIDGLKRFIRELLAMILGLSQRVVVERKRKKLETASIRVGLSFFEATAIRSLLFPMIRRI